MQRIGIFGGAFHPPHLGHTQGAQYARQALKLDRVLFMPGGTMPHKQFMPGGPTADQRLQMLRLATQGLDSIEISTLEMARGGVAYTCDTVSQVCRENPDAEIFLLLGADAYGKIPGWKNAGEILQNVTLAVLRRGEKEEQARLCAAQAEITALGGKTLVLDNPVTVISSTDLRRLLAFGCTEEFLHPGVLAYIRSQGLYGTGADYRNLPIDRLEQVVVSLLKPNRVAHVLGCRQAAVALARHYGADETDAARAALLHDITKALDGPLQLTLCRGYGTMLSAFSANNPKTLHALTGSLVAQRIFGENDAVVNAIRCHTTGKSNMNLLEKIIYVADYMEPNRDFPGVEVLRDLAYRDITQALKLGLTMTLDMLRAQQREISPESSEALAYLESCGV